jgi:hypothetical protein
MVDPSPSSKSPYAGLADKIRPEGSADVQALSAERAARPPIVRVALARGTLLLRPFSEPCCVVVDGTQVGQLTSQERFQLALAAGNYSVQVTRGWLRSNVCEFSVANGDVVQFLCTGHHAGLDLIFGVALFYAALWPSHFYRLRPFHP